MKVFDIVDIQEKIGYRFKNQELLKQAFTHSSYANENNVESYERLEYLGDAILNFVIASYLFKNCPEYSQKTLTDIRSELVKKPTLAAAVDALAIAPYIFTSKGDLGNKNGLSNKLKCDLFESILGSIAVDNAYNLENAEIFIFKNLSDKIDYLKRHGTKNYVNEIKERCEKEKREYFYRILNEENPPKPPFQVVLVVSGVEVSFGNGGTKTEAEQMAAEAYYRKLSQ